jgi:hypothetical protein
MLRIDLSAPYRSVSSRKEVELAECPWCSYQIMYCLKDYRKCPGCARVLPRTLQISENEIARLAYYNTK